jgi:hypothetical protein
VFPDLYINFVLQNSNLKNLGNIFVRLKMVFKNPYFVRHDHKIYQNRVLKCPVQARKVIGQNSQSLPKMVFHFKNGIGRFPG